VSGNVEVHVRLLDAIALAIRLLHERALLEDEAVQAARVGDVVEPPVVGELEAGEVVVAVVDRTAQAERFVAVATGPECGQDASVGLHLDGDASQPDADTLQHAIRLEPVGQLLHRHVVVHREPENLHRLVVAPWAHRVERAPGHLARDGVGKARAQQARNDDDRIAVGAVVLRRGVVLERELLLGRLAERSPAGPTNAGHRQAGRERGHRASARACAAPDPRRPPSLHADFPLPPRPRQSGARIY